MIELNSEQKMILETVRQIVKDKVRPRAAEIDERAEFPWDTVKIFAENGILAPLLPEKYGGIGTGYLTFSMILEEIAKACASSALILIAQADGFLPILYAGNDAQKDRYLPGLAGGKLAGFAATEPDAGSDILSMKSSAVRKGDFYILNGQKCFITNGSIADILTVYAFTDPEKGPAGISAFLVEKGFKGLCYGKDENKMGMRGSINSQLFFEDMEVPAENLIGREGKGIASMMPALDTSRLFSASQAVGLAQGAIDEAVSYAGERIQFGRAISHLQAIQFMIADMEAGTEAARLMAYRAAGYLDAKEWRPARKACAMAKFIASDNAMKVTTDAVQIMGGYGYMKDYPVERMMRDAKLIQIYTGTNQIMRLVTAREIFGNNR
ncbi:MAG: acyl-CoA dehydrogenase family protein [Deltaproteobacteria bacterium]|nr:acyl-CoA dehydrogenase family protein [Deltaproteobacteria bacterium]MBW2048360.1 acyl-CoA dehydrogenase family protein [Deltaproteobacteria bacterium]MBW2111406.1 acyl-CoA dehydrogenase family protein [Deltaproteobacteria bacterium]MBW2353595.1 acyl-CoA dehydrogenase family protein [Deltaproteobacteria bacterium]